MTTHQAQKLDYRALLQDAYQLAAASTDPSTQIGAFLVSYSGQVEWLTRSFNRPVQGWKMAKADWERPRKYNFLEHAERGCLDRAAFYGICTAGCTMVATWAACCDCSRGLIACGVKTLVRHSPPDDEASARWLESVALGDEMMKRGGITLIDITGPIPGAPPILRNGQLFDPSL